MKKIAFVQRRPHIRVYKIAKALKYTGKYNLVCICDYNYFDNKLFNGIFDKVYYYNKNNFISRIKGYNRINKILKIDFKRICRILEIIKPDIVNCFSEPYDYITYILKNVKYPVVLIDGNDFSGISSGIENIDKKTRKEEKYCFENVSGICHKGPEFEIDYYRQHGYKINCPKIQWLDYCDEDLFVDNSSKELSEEDGEVHLVHIGTISNNPKYRYNYLIPLGKKLAKQKIHLHVYRSSLQTKTFKEYSGLDKKEKYFHSYGPVSFKELNKEIAKYDWHSHILEDFVGPRFTPEKQRVSMGNKLFSSLEAGLPMIVSYHLESVRELTEKYKIGFAVKDEHLHKLKEIINGYDYKELQMNVLKAREELSLKNQIHRLERFYEEFFRRKNIEIM